MMVDLIRRRFPDDPTKIRPEDTLDSGTPVIRKVSPGRPLHWLRQGWRDLRRRPSALLHGLVVAVVGMIAVWATLSHPWLSFALIAGFVLVGPVLAVKLNMMARSLEQEAEAGRSGRGAGSLAEIGAPLARFTAILLSLFIVWTGYTWLWIAVMNVGELGLPTHAGELLQAMLSSTSGVVSLVGVAVIWLALAFVAFAISVVTVPAMLGQRLGLVDAVVVSLKAFRENLPALIFWAALITGLFVFSVLTAFVALIVIFPWLGLATWHSYRDMVVTGTDRGE
jgi:uncharacterized membrane protein